MSGDMTQLYPFLFPFFPFLSRKALAFSFALLVMYISHESHEVVDGNCWITEVVEYLLSDTGDDTGSYVANPEQSESSYNA